LRAFAVSAGVRGSTDGAAGPSEYGGAFVGIGALLSCLSCHRRTSGRTALAAAIQLGEHPSAAWWAKFLVTYKRAYPSRPLVPNLGRSRRDDEAIGDLLESVEFCHSAIVRYAFGDFQTAYLRARGLSPLGAAEGAGSQSPARIISKSVTPMPSCRAIGSGPLDCARNR
jgi:hypothetical protein